MDTTTKKAPLRARDITIGEELIDVRRRGEDSLLVPVPRALPSLDDLNPIYLEIAKALEGEPIYTFSTEAVEDARESADEAAERLSHLEAIGLRGYAGEVAHKRDEDVTEDDEARVREDYEDELERLREQAAERPAQNATRPVEHSKPAALLEAECLATCAGELFTVDNGRTLKVALNAADPHSPLIDIERPKAFKSWMLRTRHDWVQGRSGGVDIETLFEYVKQGAPKFKGVCDMVHIPKVDGIHYRMAPPPKDAETLGAGEALEGALGLLCPKTEEDGLVIAAGFAAPAFGIPGATPITGVVAEGGNGKGKSSVVHCISRAWGGPENYESCAMPKDPIQLADAVSNFFFKVAGHVDDGGWPWVLNFDNVRGNFDLTDLCSQVKEPVLTSRVKGKKRGTGAPNVFGYYLSSNNFDPSGEAARRIFVAQLKPYGIVGDWEGDVDRFYEKHAWQVRDDIYHVLTDYADEDLFPVPQTEKHTTFVPYERKVLWPMALYLKHGDCAAAETLFSATLDKLTMAIADMDADYSAGLDAEIAISGLFADEHTIKGRYFARTDESGYKKMLNDRPGSEIELACTDEAVNTSKACFIKMQDLRRICKANDIDVNKVIEAAGSGKCRCLVKIDTGTFPSNDVIDKDGRKVRRARGLLYIPDENWDGTSEVQALQYTVPPKPYFPYLAVVGVAPMQADKMADYAKRRYVSATTGGNEANGKEVA